jgi:hypothetical protein
MLKGPPCEAPDWTFSRHRAQIVERFPGTRFYLPAEGSQPTA